MSTKQRRDAYRFCVDRDGEQCVDCGRVPATIVKDPDRETTRLVVDHVDNDPANNSTTNWALRCTRCNIKKNPRGRQAFPKFSSHLRLSNAPGPGSSSNFASLNHKMISRRKEDVESEAPRVRWVETAKGLQAEPLFREFVDKTMKRLHAVKKLDLLDAAAEDFTKRTGNNISQQCLSKYLSKLCNPINGSFELKEVDGEWYVVEKPAEVRQ